MEHEKDSKEILETFPYDREAYSLGELPLDYTSQLSDGSLLIANDNEAGDAKVLIQKDGQTILDFKDLAPKGTIFNTPRARKYEENFSPNRSAWYGDKKEETVTIGDFRNPKDIIALLHEIGHVKGDLFIEDRFVLPEEKHYNQMKNEKRANDFAIESLKKISAGLGIDLMEEIFGNEENLRRIFSNIINNKQQNYEKAITITS